MTQTLPQHVLYFDRYGYCPCGCVPRERFVINRETNTATLYERSFVLVDNKRKIEKLDPPEIRQIVWEDGQPCLGEVV